MQRGDRVGGRFEILGEAGSGGMGTVFRARDVRAKREVAVKIVTGQTAEETARFAREAEILATIAHRSIVGYVAHGDGYLVMEWVGGETLAQRLARLPLAGREAVTFGYQLAGALAALHAAGIVHRDVKPANLMLTSDQIKLVDFGIARSTSAARLTRTGMHVGTAGYMAPEQARGDTAITGGADVFALGCVLHECLTGTPAFRGDNAMALRAKVLLHDPPRLRSVAPELPVALEELLDRMLARDPAQRPGAAEVADALAQIASDDALDREVAPNATTDESTATSDQPTCAVLISLEDDEAIAQALASGTARRFDGGAIAMCPHATAAAKLAVELAGRLPEAMIAVACGRSASDAIDRTARLVEQLAIAAETGAAVAGAWIDDAAAKALGDRIAIEREGKRNRLRGVAS